MTVDVNATDIISMSECFVMWHIYTDFDDNGDPTGWRELVEVTHVREDPDADMVGDPPRFVDCTAYYIAKAHRVASGKEIPERELDDMRYIDFLENLNPDVLTDDDSDSLSECIQDRAFNIARSEAGY